MGMRTQNDAYAAYVRPPHFSWYNPHLAKESLTQMGKLTKSELLDITRREVGKYAGVSRKAKAYKIFDEKQHIYTVTSIRNAPGDDHAWIIVQARVVGDVVVIDEDNVFDKKLVHALTQAGVPREQIILQYAGEPVPTMNEEPAS
jgi:hypothetical protein